MIPDAMSDSEKWPPQRVRKRRPLMTIRSMSCHENTISAIEPWRVLALVMEGTLTPLQGHLCASMIAANGRVWQEIEVSCIVCGATFGALKRTKRYCPACVKQRNRDRYYKRLAA